MAMLQNMREGQNIGNQIKQCYGAHPLLLFKNPCSIGTDLLYFASLATDKLQMTSISRRLCSIAVHCGKLRWTDDTNACHLSRVDMCDMLSKSLQAIQEMLQLSYEQSMICVVIAGGTCP